MFYKKVFIHIPKCAGNTVEVKLSLNDIAFSRVEPGVKYIDMPDTDFLSGHISYDQFAGNADVRFFSVIRSPLERAVSHYYYNLKIREESPEFFKIKGMGLEQFLLEHENTMCKHMFGRKIMDSNEPVEVKFDLCRRIMDEQYLFIGNVSQMKHLDGWLCRSFGCIPYQVHQNRNEYVCYPEISSSVKLKFMQQNLVDYMIYELVGSYWLNTNSV